MKEDSGARIASKMAVTSYLENPVHFSWVQGETFPSPLLKP